MRNICAFCCLETVALCWLKVILDKLARQNCVVPCYVDIIFLQTLLVIEQLASESALARILHDTEKATPSTKLQSELVSALLPFRINNFEQTDANWLRLEQLKDGNAFLPTFLLVLLQARHEFGTRTPSRLLWQEYNNSASHLCGHTRAKRPSITAYVKFSTRRAVH